MLYTSVQVVVLELEAVLDGESLALFHVHAGALGKVVVHLCDDLLDGGSLVTSSWS